MPTLDPRLIAILAVTFTLACSHDGFDAVDTGTDQYDEPDTELPGNQGQQPTDDDQQVDDTGNSSQQDTEDSIRTDWTACYDAFTQMEEACYDQDHRIVYFDIEIDYGDPGFEDDTILLYPDDADDDDMYVNIVSNLERERLEFDANCDGFSWKVNDNIWLIVADGSPNHRPPGYVAPSDSN